MAYYCTSNSFESRQDHFVCSTSRKKGKDVCDTHFIRAVVLEEGTLQHMRMVISCVASYEDAFRKALGAKRNAEAKKELTAKKRTLQKSENRLAELDRLFKRIYEDMVNGKLSESRFQMLSEDYEKEQADLRIKIEMPEEEIQNQEDQADNVDKFIRQAKKLSASGKIDSRSTERSGKSCLCSCPGQFQRTPGAGCRNQLQLHRDSSCDITL